ncbi:calcium-dependent tyrosine protein kinase [Gracilaria domingensis]|nr:calcium-dependent tyrosine protein kinase [Gracilaria domingensis]
MELCGGGSMIDIVRLYPEERMPEETARFFLRQVLEALSYCHSIGICHRDVRLDNLMLDNEGNMKITDFGHSGMYTPGWDMFSSALVGSVYNLSPEQIMGHVYSGERIDIWSAGVAVYCLLVGRPPFYEPEVNALLERVLACDFEIPDFVSPSAADFIRCMIRGAPEERIPLQQMLHHPWFYDGPEFGPSMNVVVIPVDKFFEKRPDIAEMIMAMTIYQHHLHFHLADTQNPRAAPLSLRGQDWTLKCLCPKNDIKFTVSLFTRKPETYRRRKRSSQLTSPVSLSTLSEPPSTTNPLIRKRSDHEVVIGRHTRCGAHGGGASASHSHALKTPSDSFSEFSTPSPPHRRRVFQITPMDVAVQLRLSGGNGFTSLGFGEILDLDGSANADQFPARTFRDDMLAIKDSEWKACGADDRRRNGKWRSFENPSGNLTRLNRSATVDAFPYQKIYPKRQMPESARKLKFDRPQSPAPGRAERGGAHSVQEGRGRRAGAEEVWRRAGVSAALGCVADGQRDCAQAVPAAVESDFAAVAADIQGAVLLAGRACGENGALVRRRQGADGGAEARRDGEQRRRRRGAQGRGVVAQAAAAGRVSAVYRGAAGRRRERAVPEDLPHAQGDMQHEAEAGGAAEARDAEEESAQPVCAAAHCFWSQHGKRCDGRLARVFFFFFFFCCCCCCCC